MTDTDTEKAEQKKSAIQEYTVATARLSEHVRFIAFGILAIVYALYTSDSAIAGRIVEAHPIKLGVATVAALVAILLDYAQYFASVRATRNALDEEDATWDENSLSYRASELAFNWKQLATVAASVALLWIAISIPTLHHRSQTRSEETPSARQLRNDVDAASNRMTILEQRLRHLEGVGSRPDRPVRCQPTSESWRSDGTFTRTCRD